MGKKLTACFMVALCVTTWHVNAEKVLEWKDTSASSKLDSFLGFHRSYRCNLAKGRSLEFVIDGIGLNRYESVKTTFAERNIKPPPLSAIVGFEYETIQNGKRVGEIARSWGLLEHIDPPPDRIGQKAKLTLSDGESVGFETFAEIPEWPISTTEKLKPYFFLYFNEQKVKCGGVMQLD